MNKHFLIKQLNHMENIINIVYSSRKRIPDRLPPAPGILQPTDNTLRRPSPQTIKILSALLAIVFITPTASFAAEVTERIDLSEQLNMIGLFAASVLVFFMQAGFALVESGASRAKNAVNVIMKNYSDICLGSLIFFLVGYGLMYSADYGGFSLASLALINITDNQYIDFFFQTMFAASAVTICSGAMAERCRFPAYLLAACLIMGVIFPIFAGWVWSDNGWLNKMGFIDFAGSTVVHSVGGWCALAGIVVLGPRLGRFGKQGEVRKIPGHSSTLVALGGFILWFGWFGFNAGTAIGTEYNIGKVLTNTQLAASAGVMATVFFCFFGGRKTTVMNLVNGCLGGLVSVTAGCATMSPTFAIITGACAGLIVPLSENMFESMGVDDVVGAVSVHGVAGAWGTLAAGIFLEGNYFNAHQIAVQAIGICSAAIWGLSTALALFYGIDFFWKLRTDDNHERQGLDFAEHAEVGYPEFQMNLLHSDSAQ